MVALNAGSAAVRLALWIRIFSSIGVLNSLSAMRATLPDSPGPLVVESSALVPRTPPIANAATTNASQPNVAVFQWLADQRPMRAAMCLDLARDDICVGLLACRWGLTAASPSAGSQPMEPPCVCW